MYARIVKDLESQRHNFLSFEKHRIKEAGDKLPSIPLNMTFISASVKNTTGYLDKLTGCLATNSLPLLTGVVSCTGSSRIGLTTVRVGFETGAWVA